MTERLTELELLRRAARGVGKVDQMGKRGITLVNEEEIEAMAVVLACLGIIPIPPGTQEDAQVVQIPFRGTIS